MEPISKYIHQAQQFMERAGFSRFMVDPHTTAEVFGMLFDWMFIFGALAMLWILIETMTTPNEKRLDKDFRYSKVFHASVVIVLLCVPVFLIYCVIPMYIPELHRFFLMTNYQ